MSDVMKKLELGRGLAWSDLVPAFDHAIALAEEAEALAYRVQNEMQMGCSAAYPPLVRKLAESVRDDEIAGQF